MSDYFKIMPTNNLTSSLHELKKGGEVGKKGAETLSLLTCCMNYSIFLWGFFFLSFYPVRCFCHSVLRTSLAQILYKLYFQ